MSTGCIRFDSGDGVNCRGPSNTTRGDFAKSDALAFSCFDKASQCFRHFLNRQPLIPPVQIIDVHAIDAQFLKAFIKTLLKESFAIVVRKTIVALVRITNPDPPFCRDREKITGCWVTSRKYSPITVRFIAAPIHKFAVSRWSTPRS